MNVHGRSESPTARSSARPTAAGSGHLSLWYWKGSLSDKLLATARRGVPGVRGLKVKGSQVPDGDIDSKVRTKLIVVFLFGARHFLRDLAAGAMTL
ncbi:hypothetical protein ACH5A2_13030 [Streptomyces collinus]|uniref:hypothetical protein n=1 Tax=Streptomyces collinus TaxID=42684 RepID=UPI00379A4893